MNQTPFSPQSKTAVTLTVIVPAYNEQAFIGTILERLLAEPTDKEIFVVDDGSVDQTAAIVGTFADRGVVLMRHEKNAGKGAAIHTALTHATGRFVIIQDADLEYDPTEFGQLLTPLLAGAADVVYGSRNLRDNPRVSNLFYWGGKAVTILANWLFWSNLTDEATGYKAFKREVLQGMHLTSRGFGFCAEVTGKLLRGKVKIIEVPISYTPRSWDEGKKIRMKHGVGAALILIWYRFTARQCPLS